LANIDPYLFERLLAEQESEWVEFKSSSFEPTSIGKYASALANSARLVGQSAGYLIWGVSDDGTVIGTDLDPPAETVQREPFEFWLSRRLHPQDHSVRFVEGTMHGKRLIAMVTEAADRVPVKFDKIAYIRIGSATPPLHEQPGLERQLLGSLATTTFEADPACTHAKAADACELLDVNAALDLLQQPKSSDDDENFSQLERLGLIQADGAATWTITNAAAILFARSLTAFGPSYERKAPRVVIYDGDNRLKTRTEQVGARGYAVAFEGLVRFLDSRLPRSEQLHGVLRREYPMYPMEALREIVANALIHQDLAVRGAGPLIEIFDGRIDISNPRNAAHRGRPPNRRTSAVAK
jgi:predicted HTH transcriptional regulator